MEIAGDLPHGDDPDVIEGIKSGPIEIVAGVRSVDAHGVTLTDGTTLSPDAIIAATGFGTGLEPMAGYLGVLDDQGMPDGSDGSATAAGLYFLGAARSEPCCSPREPVDGLLEQRDGPSAGLARARAADTYRAAGRGDIDDPAALGDLYWPRAARRPAAARTSPISAR